MRAHHSIRRLVVPLAVGGLALAMFLPGREPDATQVAAVIPQQVNGPHAEPIAVARVGTVMLTPIPLTQAAPELATPAVPTAAAIATPAPPPVETTASVPDTPTAALRGGEPSMVGSRAVNLRVGPSKGTASLAVLQPGEPVQVLEQSEGWTYISTLSGDTGWVSSTFLGRNAPADKAVAPKREARAASGGKAIRATGPVTIRSGPSSMSERLFVVEPGEPMRIAETRGNWARIVLDNGVSGWVRVRRAD